MEENVIVPAGTLRLPLNLRQKLLAVMRDVGAVAKKGQNTTGASYSYQRIADILPKVQQACIDHGVVFMAHEVAKTEHDGHQSRQGGAIFVYDVEMEYRFYDTDSEEVITGRGSGLAFDSSDKALNKAKTAALKYFLKQTFLIGEDEDDADGETHEVVPQAQVACPNCGMVGTIRKGRPEYGGGWYCNRKAGGCGQNYADDPAMQTKPKAEMPRAEAETPRRAPRKTKDAPSVETTATAASETLQTVLADALENSADNKPIPQQEAAKLAQEIADAQVNLKGLLAMIAKGKTQTVELTWAEADAVRAWLAKRREAMARTGS